MTSAATPVDSAQGTVQDTPTLPQASQSQHKKFVVRNQRTCWHYVTNAMDYGGATVHDILAGDGTGGQLIRSIKKDLGWQNIPYTIMSTAWQENKMLPALSMACRARVLEMGYTMNHFTTLQENLIPRSGSTVLENAFESKPMMMLYKVDPMNSAGYTTMSTVNNYRQMMRQRRQLGKCNGFCSRSDPIDQADGMLPRVFEYFQTQSGMDISGNQKWSFFSPYDTDDISFFPEGKSWSHTWKDPSPTWWPVGRQFTIPWQCGNNNPATDWNNFRYQGYFPESRREALDWDYQNWQYIKRANERGEHGAEMD